MIVSDAELLLMLGLSAGATDEERAIITLLHGLSESAVEAHIGYSPLQATGIEYYPLADRPAALGDIDDAASYMGVPTNTLQLSRVPLRQVISLYSEPGARFGAVSGSWASSTLLVEGTDFSVQWERQYLCRSGLLYCAQGWDVEPGSIKVEYRAGYSLLELYGRATATSNSDANGEYTTAGVNASLIRSAVIKTVLAAMQRWSASKKNLTAGFVGPLTAERLGDYSYQRAATAMQQALGALTIPADALEDLEPFVFYGRLRA